MTISRRFLVFVLVTLSCGLFVVGCDDVVSDPNFHTWCGDQLCSWKLESGKIQRAPTWNPKDYGVELLDSTDANHITAISQVVEKTPKCLEFSTVADVAVEAQVSIGVDFDNDGTLEVEQPIAAAGFTEQKTQVTAPLSYRNIRFVITKRGSGRAVLAQMNVTATTDCTATPVRLKEQVLGTQCAIDGQGQECKSGICCNGLCAECCEAGDEQRDGDGGIVYSGPASACSDRGSCKTLPLVAIDRGAESFGVVISTLPLQCDPGSRKRNPGSECLLDEDCISNGCQGAEWVIVDEAIGGPPCPPPPAQGKDCNVTSVHAGICR